MISPLGIVINIVFTRRAAEGETICYEFAKLGYFLNIYRTEWQNIQ